jgi:hypothetical protein
MMELPRTPSQATEFNALARRNPHRSRRALLTHHEAALGGCAVVMAHMKEAPTRAALPL